jgi:hypothetical protein
VIQGAPYASHVLVWHSCLATISKSRVSVPGRMSVMGWGTCGYLVCALECVPSEEIISVHCGCQDYWWIIEVVWACEERISQKTKQNKTKQKNLVDRARCWCLMLVILATQEAEMKRIPVWSQPRQIGKRSYLDKGHWRMDEGVLTASQFPQKVSGPWDPQTLKSISGGGKYQPFNKILFIFKK